MGKQWADLSWQERREERFKRWLSRPVSSSTALKPGKVQGQGMKADCFS